MTLFKAYVSIWGYTVNGKTGRRMESEAYTIIEE